jgi:hypothetical protein
LGGDDAAGVNTLSGRCAAPTVGGVPEREVLQDRADRSVIRVGDTVRHPLQPWSPPDRRRRLEMFAEAYGLATADGLVDEVIAVQRRGLDRVAQLAAQGHQRQVAAVQAGELDQIRRRISWSERHRHLFDPQQ